MAGFISTSACLAAPCKELLLNPGAEQGKNELPSVWYEARILAEGLQMHRDSKQAKSGNYSLAISNAHKYEQMVSNNWAQKISEVPAGKTVRLSAFIKTKDADSVNVCLQCWDSSGKMVAFASTNVLRGDYDWTLLRTEPVTVPPDTAYLCVRAALTGLGQAWFDDFSLRMIEERDKSSNREKELPVKPTKEEMIKSIPIAKDCMVLKYMPEWNHGNIDNLGVSNNGGGVRSFLTWSPISSKYRNDQNCTFQIVLYSRQTTSNPSAGKIEAYEILEDWPERISWKSQPVVAKRPVAQFEFVPEKGWKHFDITPLIRNPVEGKKSHGLMLRFNQENRKDNEFSGYVFVSREGLGQWKSFRPELHIVKKER